MIYQTGTITTTAGQTKIKGTSTRWKDNLAGISEGCPISYLINNTVFMNTVLSVNSDTEINLTYPVPVTATAAKYQIATFVLDSMSDGVRKMLANQQYIQYFLRNMDTWMTQDGIVEVKTPTGETVRIESIIALKKLIDGKLSLGGGTISKNGEALTIKAVSDNQAIFLKFRDSSGRDLGYFGKPNDTDRISLVNSTAGTSLTLSEEKRLLWQGKDVPTLVNPQAQDTAVQYATPMWIIRSNGVNGEWVKIAKIGGAGSSYGGSRYLFTLNCTTSGFSSQSNFPAFAHLSITIGNGSNPNRNVEASFIGLEAYGINNRAPVRIRQLSAFEAEIWVGIGAYSRLSCSCITYDSMVPYSNSFINDIPLSENADKSVYEGANNYLYAAANKDGNVQSRESLKISSSGNFPNVTLAKGDGSLVSLEANPSTSSNFLNFVHRFSGNSVVVGVPNKSGSLVQIGDFGLGDGVSEALTDAQMKQARVFRSFRQGGGTADRMFGGWGCGIAFPYDTTRHAGIFINNQTSALNTYIKNNLGEVSVQAVYSTANTTKDSNGNLKVASPIIKVFAEHIDTNEESEGVTLKKLHTGIYQLHGVLGLHSDASWGGVHGGITIPCGINQLPLVYTLYDVLEKGKPHPFDGRIVEPDEDGDIVLYTTYRKHDLPQNIQYERFKLYPEFLKEVDGEMVELTPGEPCDIPNGHWIDVRVNMPSDSIYNQKLAEAERLAKIEAERVAKEEAEKLCKEADKLEEKSKQEQANK